MTVYAAASQTGNNHHVIARRTKSDVAIRIRSDTQHRPLPVGAEEKRIATAYDLAMTAGDGSWFFSLTAQKSRVIGGVSDPALH